MKRTVLSWSSGKDSAWTLHALRRDDEHEVVALLTTITREYDRVSMHAVRRELVEAQANAAGLELWTVEIPAACTNTDYEDAMGSAVRRAVEARIECVAFGDLFLRDVREYREQRLAGSGLQPVFPLWDYPTRDLAEEMIRGGMRARLTCIDPRVMPRSLAGRDFDRELLASLPPNVDACGEHGEFHTFAYEGPMFDRSISIVNGETVERDGFVFTDLRSSNHSSQ